MIKSRDALDLLCEFHCTIQLWLDFRIGQRYTPLVEVWSFRQKVSLMWETQQWFSVLTSPGGLRDAILHLLNC